MSDLSTQLQQACSQFSLRLDLGYTAVLENGVKVLSFARLPDLGGPDGLLIFTTHDEVSQFRDQIVSKYGYSVLNERDSTFDAEVWREMFIDWKWSGKRELKPKWMTEPPLAELANILALHGDDTLKEDTLRKIATIHWEDEKAEQIIFELACTRNSSGDNLYSTCMYALADLWINKGKINQEMYKKLNDKDLTDILRHWFKELESTKPE